MRVQSLLYPSFLAAALFAVGSARADLPDLRGQKFFVTGRIFAGGTAFGQNFATLIPNGIEVSASNPFRLEFASDGDINGNGLHASLIFPKLDSCTNPVISTLTGSFNRSNGSLTLTGSLGTGVLSIIDFGTTDLGNGETRILGGFENMGISIAATGSVGADGVFRLKQPGTSAFSYTLVNNTNPAVGKPVLSLQDPSLCTLNFQVIDVVKGSYLELRNWEARQTILKGNALPGYVSTAPAKSATFAFRTPGTTTALFTLEGLLKANGDYTVPNVNPGTYDLAITGFTHLRRVIPGIVIDKLDVTAPSTTLLSGNATGDNSVNFDDFQALADAYFTTSSDALYDEKADFNADGEVNFDDFQILADNYFLDGDE